MNEHLASLWLFWIAPLLGGVIYRWLSVMASGGANTFSFRKVRLLAFGLLILLKLINASTAASASAARHKAAPARLFPGLIALMKINRAADGLGLDCWRYEHAASLGVF